jgi:23S rRNA (uracil1939-C5)-methyltransferase
LRIERLGADGDGIAHLPDGKPAYVARALPGETVRVALTARRGEGWAATLEDVIEPGPDRIAPPCPHFGSCGGCAVQHMRDDGYAAWKSALLTDALKRAGFADPPVAEMRRTPPGTRRRMDLALRRAGGRVIVGLHAPRSRDVIDLTTCPVLHPDLFALIAPLRDLLRPMQALRDGSAIVNLLDSGPDLLLRTDAPLTTADRTALTSFARRRGLPRISWALKNGAPEPVCVLRPAVTTLSGGEIAPPPGAFLQASAAGEAAIIEAVLAGLPERLPAKARIVELYAGCGTLSFALSTRARVQAFEGDAAAFATLRKAAAGHRIEVRLRDLARQPLTAAECNGATALVLDPPYAGAAAQMPALAASGIAQIVYVSCNPAALARDARVLNAAGYRVLRATPIDQFLWSPRLESVVVFARQSINRSD